LRAVLALLLAASARAAPMPALREGSARFFHGDLAGAVESWRAAREAGGSREFDALLSSALTALGKGDLAKGRYESARRRFDEALSMDPGSRALRRLALTAELGEQAGGLRTLKPEETDTTEEMDRLLTALLLLDRPVAPPAPPRRAAPPSVAASTAAPAVSPSAAAAAAFAPEETERSRRRAQSLYERGLTSYYAGSYDKALSFFYAASDADPGLEKARRAVGLVNAALRRRQADGRYQDALRTFYQGDTRTARAKLQEALVLDPGHVKARQTLEKLDAAAPPPP
jgi:tetratricopeptide (TPR) repeat protein